MFSHPFLRTWYNDVIVQCFVSFLIIYKSSFNLIQSESWWYHRTDTLGHDEMSMKYLQFRSHNQNNLFRARTMRTWPSKLIESKWTLCETCVRQLNLSEDVGNDDLQIMPSTYVLGYFAHFLNYFNRIFSSIRSSHYGVLLYELIQSTTVLAQWSSSRSCFSYL